MKASNNMEYYEYPDYIDIMELYVETLTGTIFELHVSPFETVISVKAKIQRVEGIPIGQQHLIYRSIELEDEYCLQDYGIPPGASLKLVLAMRGGPINTRRIPMEDPAIREMADYMEANKDEIWEKLPGNRQVTLLVFREGDQLNFFRVVDRGDGTLTPLSESLSGASVHNGECEEEVETGKELTVEQEVENDATMNKMKLLRAKMENLSLVKKTKVPRPPSRPRSVSKRHMSSVRTVRGTKPSINKVEPLPPVRTSIEKENKTETADLSTKSNLTEQLRTRSRSGPQVRTSLSDDNVTSDRALYGSQSAKIHAMDDQKELSVELKTTVLSPPRKGEAKRPLSRPRVLSAQRTHISTGNTSQQLTAGGRRRSPLPNGLAQQNLEKLSAKFHRNHRKQTNNLPHFTQGTISEGTRPATCSQRVPSTLPTKPDSGLATERLSLGTADARVVTELVNQANREGKINNIVRTSQRDPLTGISSSRARISPSPAILNRVFNGSASITRSGERISTPEARQALISAQSVRGRLSGGRDGRIAVSPVCRLPPVVNTSVSPKKKSSKRCFLCNKKTGLATSYQCRCGHNYCASHRYAETHSCGFDYKTEGRKLLEQSNPLVSAPKLPKI